MKKKVRIIAIITSVYMLLLCGCSSGQQEAGEAGAGIKAETTQPENDSSAESQVLEDTDEVSSSADQSSTDNSVDDNSVEETTRTIVETITPGMVYADLILDLEGQYGTCRIEYYPYFMVSDDAVCYRGVCFLDLVDFNQDGQDELVVSYDSGEYDYQTAIYGIVDHKAEKLWEGYSGGDGAPAVFHAILTTKGDYPVYLQWSGVSFVGITVNQDGVAEEDDCGAPYADTSAYDLNNAKWYSFNASNKSDEEFTSTANKLTETREALGLDPVEITYRNTSE